MVALMEHFKLALISALAFVTTLCGQADATRLARVQERSCLSSSQK
jgi:hypothetical protein